MEEIRLSSESEDVAFHVCLLFRLPPVNVPSYHVLKLPDLGKVP